MACIFDRIEELLDQTTVTGIDYIYIAEDQRTLRVHFHMKGDPPAVTPAAILSGLTREQIRIYPTQIGDEQETITVAVMQWTDSDTVLELVVEEPGGYANYTLRIADERVDRHFNDLMFSFKANCESRLDCKKTEEGCPEEDEVDFPVDYQARDFWSFRRALTDFAALRYPDWQDRLEADAGMMLLEVMSALGDELSYYQDRVAREAYLETATQRRSLRHHVRLVDYEPHEGLAASTWLDVTVKTADSGTLQAGADVWAQSDKGDTVFFEAGNGLQDILTTETFFVDAAINSLAPHIWDEDHQCLKVGATEIFVNGWYESNLPFNTTTFHEGDDDIPCRWMLLKTTPADPSVKQRRWLICVVEINEMEDPLTEDPACDKVTHLVWQQAQALPFEMDMATLEVRGNLVPATAGKYRESWLTTGADIADLAPALETPKSIQFARSVERVGADASTMHLFTLPASDETPLCWLGSDPRSATPEVNVAELQTNGAVLEEKPGGQWQWARSFLDEYASLPDDEHFTLEDGNWRRVIGYRRGGEEIVHQDYAGSEGKTVRFGDNAFGKTPDQRMFKVSYRLGNGRIGNVAADTLVNFELNFNGTVLTFVESITNPLPAQNGIDAETVEEVKQLAPEAFRAVTYRAVREEDYREAAERLPWVQRAGAQLRWTGSWLTAFVTPDPVGAVTVSESQRSELAVQLDRFRQAGREAVASDPDYADIDLMITVCAQPFAYPGEVEARVLKALVGDHRTAGFFSADNFTFGDPLRRSQLEAAIQCVPGVRAVSEIQIRRRGFFEWKVLDGAHALGHWEVLRLENDPDYPDRGTLELVMEGGA
jgi:hypothetical protein